MNTGRLFLVATQNRGKVQEYRHLLEGLPYKIVGLEDVEVIKMDVPETGDTFEANAIIKARAYGAASSILTLADDSGLVVDALDGRPGVYSARYGEGDLDDAGRRAYLLEEMKDIPEANRKARFICAIAVYDPVTGAIETAEGTCEGTILFRDHDGGYGFGYDAIFQPEGYTQSFAELEPEVKNRISHRAAATSQLPDVLVRLMNQAE